MGVRDKFIDGTEKFRQQGRTNAPSDDSLEAERQAIQEEDAGIIPAPKGWPKLPEVALQGLAGDVVRTIDPHTEADPAAVLMHFLTFFGNCVGPSPFFQVGADQHHAKLFAVLVGISSSGRKGTSEGQVRRIFDTVDPDWSKRCIVQGLASGEGLIRALQPEGISAEPRLLAIEPEMVNVLRAMQRDGSTLSGVIRQAWDRGNLRVMTRKDPLRVDGAHVSMVMHIPPGELLTAMDASQGSNGFANRFIWILVRRSKYLPLPNPVSDQLLSDLCKRTAAAVDSSRRTGEMHRDEEATKRWVEVYRSLTAERRGLAGIVTSRGQVQTLRLAMMYSLLDSSALIRLRHLEAALAFWQFSCDCVSRIFGGRLGNTLAQRLLVELRDEGELTRTQVFSEVFGRNVSAQAIEMAVDLLEDYGYLKRERRPQPDGGRGRPLEVYTYTGSD